MKKLFTLILVAASCQQLYAQAVVLPKFIRKMFFETDTGRHSSFVVIPILSAAPETGLEIGGSGLYSFYTDTVNRSTHVSNVFAYASVTTKSQSNLTLNSNYWLPGNKFHLSSAISYINFPFNFYGVGNATRQADQDKIGEKRFKLNLEAEKKLGNFYLGIVAGGFDYKFTDKNPLGILQTDLLVNNRDGGASLYTGPSVLFDNRDNNTYATKGAIVTTYLNLMHGIFDNSNYKGAFFNIEYSGFFALNKQVVLGVDIQEQSLMGGQSPFYLLPALGSDEMMRGYYNGRFRDRNFIAGQTELRYRITERFGIVGFAATGEVFHSKFNINNLLPDFGGGVRYFFDIQKGLSIRMDYGIGQKRPGESRQSGFYVALGEAF